MLRVFGFLLPLIILAVGATASPSNAQTDDAARTGTILGRVVDSGTNAPVSAATVRLQELARGELSHQDGSFHFERVPAGRYIVTVQRLGFTPVRQEVVVSAGDTARVDIVLSATAISVPGIVVTGVGRERSASEAYRPTTVLDEAALRRQLGSSIAATLADEPGITQRYNGPAASQPVIRGLSGDRVLMLEDGVRTGDIAATSADHAVTIEPLTAERIEVLRGPAGLLYGSNALGGVINVVREEVPRTLPEALSGTVSAQAQSVNRGFTGGLALTAPVGAVAVRAELSGRTAQDTETPRGTLPGTDMDGLNGAAGVSWIRPDGYIGASVRDYRMGYGVPGSFNGEAIPGAHEEGVTIDLQRTTVRAEAARLAPIGPFSGLAWSGAYTRFHQEEMERDGTVGTRFGQLTASSDVTARHRHAIGELFTEGAVGASVLWQDHRTAGNAGSAPATQTTLSGYVFEELARGPVRLQAGGRYDWSRVDPLEGGETIAGEIVRRDFGAFSGSVAALLEPIDGVVFGASVSRAFRTPSIPELYSSGPHLADYSYNIGNPQLDAEYGLGADLFTRLQLTRLSAELAVYRNWISNYIHYAPTGELDPRFNRFPVYQARGDDAVLTGAEFGAQWAVLPRLVLDGQMSYVRAERSSDDEPLPAIPPLQGSIDARYDVRHLFVSVGYEAAAAQDRVSEFEAETPGYGLWRAGAGLRWSAWGDLHTLTLRVTNALDEVWFDHLSRTRAVAPQPGRSIELLYRVSF